MIVFKPKLNLKTFVALALIFFGVGFVSIIAIGYSIGSNSSSTIVGSDTPLNTTTTGPNASSTNPANAGTETKATSNYTAAATTPSSSKGGTPSTGGTVTPAPTPAPKPTPAPTPAPAPAPTYCGGQTTCYGRADLSAHATSGSCWGYIGNVMYNVTNLIASHSGGPNPIKSVCGGNIGAALSAAPSNGKHRSAQSNTAGSTLWGYKIGYYDASKP